VLVRGRKGSRAPLALMPGLILHEEGTLSAAAQAVLRHGEALLLDGEPAGGRADG
jgi:tRNA1(Val) A37 N6-methylase TrmN6